MAPSEAGRTLVPSIKRISPSGREVMHTAVIMKRLNAPLPTTVAGPDRRPVHRLPWWMHTVDKKRQP